MESSWLPPAARQTLPIPVVIDEPRKLHGSCTFVSTRVIEFLNTLLYHGSSPILSIGSGLGLLEALLSQADPSVSITGVEVESYRNERKYLAEDKMVYVNGTWSTYEVARNTRVWMFIFPRTPALLKSYVAAHASGKVHQILWIGPRDDGAMFQAAVTMGDFKINEVGEGILQPNEQAFLWARKSYSKEMSINIDEI